MVLHPAPRRPGTSRSLGHLLVVLALVAGAALVAPAPADAATARRHPATPTRAVLLQRTSVVPRVAALPSAPEVLARAQAVLDDLAALRPRQDLLVERALAGESWGFDVSAWSVPVRQAEAEAAEAGSLASAVLAAVTASGTVTDQDAADLARAEALAADSAALTTAAWDAWCGASGS